jgi:hypothetical protein
MEKTTTEQTTNANEKQLEKIIPATPHLRHIEKTLSLLSPETDEGGHEVNWKNLSEKVEPWNSGIELSNEIRNVVREYVLSKFPEIKEKIPSLSELPEDEMLNAITNGWFEEVGEEVGGKRKEVLLSVLAHIARKIETRIYKQVLHKASDEELGKLGLNDNFRQIVIDCLEASAKADPLFIRFLAYVQLSPKPTEDATATNLIGPDEAPYTFAELFPHETQAISTKLFALAENNVKWRNEPGADEFKDYAITLAEFYGETDPKKTGALHSQVEEKYKKLIATEFPLAIIPPVEGYYKPPYLDPELRVVVRTADSKAQEENFRPLQSSLADNLAKLGVPQFAEEIKKKLIRNYISIGSYGVNLTFTAAAQQEPAIILFLDEQIRAYDKNLKDFLPFVDSPEGTFSQTSPEEIESMSRNDTILHEFSHSVYSKGTPESERMGQNQQKPLAETTAESIHRGLAKEMIEKKQLPYTEDQYIAMSIGMALQSIKSNTPDDEYFQADVFVLNGLFEKGIAEFDGKKIKVKDKEAFFQYYKDNAKEIIALYEDKEVTPNKAKKWLAKKCTAGEQLQRVIEYMKTEKE